MKEGILISFSGVDGSGKSTQALLLKKYLKGKEKKVKLINVFEYYLLRPLVCVFRGAGGGRTTGPVKKNFNPLLKFWFIFAWIDFWLYYLVKIRPLLVKYDFIIADRYFYDMAVNLVYYGYMPRRFFKPLIQFLPQVNVAILLELDPKTARDRSEEFNLSYYKNQSRLYKILEQIGNFIKIGSYSDKAKVFSKIVGVIKK